MEQFREWWSRQDIFGGTSVMKTAEEAWDYQQEKIDARTREVDKGIAMYNRSVEKQREIIQELMSKIKELEAERDDLIFDRDGRDFPQGYLE